jgi:hypothetical protein
MIPGQTLARPCPTANCPGGLLNAPTSDSCRTELRLELHASLHGLPKVLFLQPGVSQMPGKSCPGFEGTSAVFLTWPLPSSAVAIGSKRTSACILGVTLPQGHEPSCQEKNLHGKEEQMKVTLYLAPRSAGSLAVQPL